MSGRVLILGGTGEARDLAARAQAAGMDVISSLAGRVRDPRLPVGEVRIGGFGGVDGLRTWIGDNMIHAVVDATHPFATRITGNAVAATSATDVPFLRLRRPHWTPDPADDWSCVPDIAAAADEIAGRRARVLLTTGRQDVGAFAGIDSAWFLIRVVDPPEASLPPHHQILRSRGPYHLDDERNLLRDNRIDVLVTKNSGGGQTHAKLVAARELGVEVIMVERPPEPPGIRVVSNAAQAMSWLDQLTSGVQRGHC